MGQQWFCCVLEKGGHIVKEMGETREAQASAIVLIIACLVMNEER